MRTGSVVSSDLNRALLDLANRGERPRCGDPDTHDLWLSDNADERVLAAAWCTGCPALDACRSTAEANDERFGVWGGVDRTVTPASARKRGVSENPATRTPDKTSGPSSLPPGPPPPSRARARSAS